MRLLFIKEGPAIWSSHLDLMRALMRSFRRAGIELKHSQGFTPHPELSILMPLSVGVESECEIAEFALAEGCELPAEEIASRLAPVLPAGVRALESWDGGQKPGKLSWLRARLTLTYDAPVGAHSVRPPAAQADGMQNAECRMQNEGSGIRDQGSGDAPVGAHSVRPPAEAFAEAPGTRHQASGNPPVGAHSVRPPAAQADGMQKGRAEDVVEGIQALFARPSIIVEKHSKKGPVATDIAPMIREVKVFPLGPTGRGPVGDFNVVAPATPEQLTSSSRRCPSAHTGADEGTLDAQTAIVLEAVVAAQNPTLNPLLLAAAIETWLPAHKPDLVQCRRLEVYDAEGRVFR